MGIKTCKNCQIKFEPADPRRLYCTEKCRQNSFSKKQYARIKSDPETYKAYKKYICNYLRKQRRRLASQRKPYTKTCLFCKQKFETTSKSKQCCSTSCRRRQWYQTVKNDQTKWRTMLDLSLIHI